MVSAVCPKGKNRRRGSAGSGSARPGQGKSGGYRTIILFRQGERAVFVYAFAKSERASIGGDEEKQFKEAARHVWRLTEKQIAELVKEGDFVEVKGHEQELSK